MFYKLLTKLIRKNCKYAGVLLINIGFFFVEKKSQKTPKIIKGSKEKVKKVVRMLKGIFLYFLKIYSIPIKVL